MRGIAISGRAASGKSSLASELLISDRFRRIAFADALKEEVLELYGLVKTDPGGRDALLKHGEVKRAEDPSYWVNRLAERAEDVWAAGCLLVIDDLRTLREYQWCRENGLLMVRVEAPVAVRRLRLAKQGMDGAFAYSMHSNEIEMESPDLLWDRLVWNPTGSLRGEALYLHSMLAAREAVV